MTLRHPAFLLFLLPIAAAILMLALRGRRIALPAAFVRIAAIGCVLVAIAGPVTASAIPGTSAVFVVDRSGSIPSSALDVEAGTIIDMMNRLAVGTRFGIVAFGGTASVVFPVGETPLDTGQIVAALRNADNIDRDHTNIAVGVRLARAMLARSGGGQIFLFSDGLENVGDARAESEAAAAEHIGVSPVKMDELSFPPDVRVAGLDVPEALWGGDALPVRVTLTGNNAWKGTLHLLVDGKPVQDAPVAAADGNAGFITTLPNLPAGTHVITARVEVTEGEDRIPENDLLTAVTTVRAKPNVLLIEGVAGEGKPVQDALTASGVNVTVKRPLEIPPRLSALDDADAIVLVDVSAKDLTLDQMTTIQQSVRANGKGLIVIGGANAYGAGNYQQTPIEQALPVVINHAPANNQQQQAVLVIIDHSGSMDDTLGATKITKISAADTAASQLVGNLPSNTIFGLNVFSDQTDTIVPLGFLPDDRSAIQDAISRIHSDGGTDIYGSLKIAIDQMRGVVASEKHVVLMTDGEDNRYTQYSDYQPLINQLTAEGVTVSTLAIGGDADTKLLQQIATAGNGTFYYVNDAKDLPQITLRAVDEAGQQDVVRGTFHPTQQAESPILTDIAPQELPNLDGYAATKAKNGAQVILDSGKHDPVLAQWQYGLGRVVAWTPDAGTVFAKQWPAWSKYGQFWHQALLWALPDPNAGALTVDTHTEGDQVVIGVDATDVDGKYVNSAPVTGTLVTPEGKSFAIQLPQVGPGRYEVHVQAATPGAYRLSLAQQRSTAATVQRAGGFAVPYSAEYAPATGGPALLGDIATLSGGAFLATANDVADTGGVAGSVTRYREWWGWFAVGALVLFVIDLALRLSLAPRARARQRAPWLNRRRTSLRRSPRKPPRRPPPSLR